MRKTLISLAFSSLSAFAAEPDCIVPRVAFDVGSSKTSVKVAIVDRCLQKIVRRLQPKTEKAWQRKVSYKEALDSTKKAAASERLTFSEAIRAQGIQAIQELKKASELALAEIKMDKGIQFSAVATAAFRTAAAADKEQGRSALSDFLMQIEKETGLKVHLLSQEKEGEVGFLAAASHAPEGIQLKDLVVWDIGGSSQQITTYQNSAFQIFQGKELASVSMKEAVLEKVFSAADRERHGKTAQGLLSPNPIGAGNAERSIAYAESTAKKEIPQSTLDLIKNGYVIGIGGVHGISVAGQVGKKVTSYDAALLEKALTERAGLTDDQIALLNNPEIAEIDDAPARAQALEQAKMFVETDVTNLALVIGYMKALGIDEVHPLKVDLGDGVLIDERLW